jgi:hypothetical protein
MHRAAIKYFPLSILALWGYPSEFKLIRPSFSIFHDYPLISGFLAEKSSEFLGVCFSRCRFVLG